VLAGPPPSPASTTASSKSEPSERLTPAEEGSCAALPAKQSAKEAQEGDADAGKAADEPEPHD
jgi:hypothetical protein